MRFEGQITGYVVAPNCSIPQFKTNTAFASKLRQLPVVRALMQIDANTGRTSSCFPHAVFASASSDTSKGATEPNSFSHVSQPYVDAKAEKHSVPCAFCSSANRSCSLPATAWGSASDQLKFIPHLGKVR